MRTKWSVTSDYEIYNKIKQLSVITRIPVSKLLDEAIEDLLVKHNFIEKVKSDFPTGTFIAKK